MIIAKVGAILFLLGIMAKVVGESFEGGNPLQGFSIGALSMWGFVRFLELLF